jgi:hypothetical protein
MILSTVISSEGYDTLRQAGARKFGCGFATTIRSLDLRRSRPKIKAESGNNETNGVPETWPGQA